MTKLSSKQLYGILDQWDIDSNKVNIRPYGSGHINDTYLINDKNNPDSTSYILQRVNHDVFTEPEKVMRNIVDVTTFLAKKIGIEGGNPRRETLNVLPTVDGEALNIIEIESANDEDYQEYWRLYIFVEDTVDFQQSPSLEIFAESASAFGRFARRLIDYPAGTLHETIERFHDTPKRFDDFLLALKADQVARAKTCQPEINFFLEREQDCHVLQDLLENDQLPVRVTHNDTKLNNVLFDRETGKGLCVIDLDTVMPGLLAHDYGDSIRFGASTALEDEPDLTKVHFSLELFEAYTVAYLTEVGPVMTEKELETLAWGARLMTLECGLRFLTDYLAGDTYFKIERKNHNLDRARTQIKLVSEMEVNFDKMQEIIMKSKN